MNIDIYKESKQLFDNHVLECKKKLKFNNNDIRYRRYKMDVKVRHSYRVVNNMKDIFNNLKINQSYINLGKAVGILHDLGRFRQMLETGTYLDLSSFDSNSEIKDHADYAVKILFDEKLIYQTRIDEKYFPVLYNAIKYHGKNKLPYCLTYKVNNIIGDFNKSSVDEFLSSCKQGDLQYLKFLSIYAQAIRDADKIDIYYQNLTNELPITRPYFYCNPKRDSLNKIAKEFGLTEEEIIRYNNLDSNDISELELIKIPVANMNINKLAISDELIDLFMKNELLDFKVLVENRGYNFITATLVRLNFLRDINFVSTLISLKEKQILEKIYDMYPSEYKPLLSQVFRFAQDNLIDGVIKENAGKIYIKK